MIHLLAKLLPFLGIGLASVAQTLPAGGTAHTVLSLVGTVIAAAGRSPIYRSPGAK